MPAEAFRHPPASLRIFSVIMPARDEEGSLPSTLKGIYSTFSKLGIPHELLVVDDASKDNTWNVLTSLRTEIPTLAPIKNTDTNGFGRAIIHGLNNMNGDACVIMMADASDSPIDAARYWRLLTNEGLECAFGSRFIKGGNVTDYPRVKLAVNRLANLFAIFRISLNDATNAFKGLPEDSDRRLPAVSFSALQTDGRNTTEGNCARLHMDGANQLDEPEAWRRQIENEGNGLPQFFICAYVWLEKYFSRGDDVRKRVSPNVN
jgi:dolichol-phosphate mannosyltransferase